ncbi:unnamed protein product, partial [marine sediment metagenome]
LWHPWQRLGRMKNLWRGIRNLVLFFPVVWRYRGWDWHYSYVLFMRALELQRNHISECQNHTEWERDVASIDLALARWRVFDNADVWDEENRVWDLLHDHLKRNARGWWD